MSKCYKGGGLVEAMHFLLNITVIYPIFSFKKILFYYIFCQKWLDTLHYLLLIQIAFFSRLVTVSKPTATNSRVSDGYLTQTQQFSVITWREQTNFKWDDDPWCPFCTRPTRLRSCTFLSSSSEATNTNCMVFGLQTVEDVNLESAIHFRWQKLSKLWTLNNLNSLL